MATDNTVLPLVSTPGDTVRDLAESGGVKWPVQVACYAVTVSAGANVLQIVDPTHGLPVAISAALPAGTNLIGKTGIDQTTPGTTNAVVDRPVTGGGLVMFHLVGAASTNATVVKNQAGQVYDVQIYNLSSQPRYVKFYDTSSAPTAGSGTPVKVVAVPGNSSLAGVVKNWDKGLAFASGIAFVTVTGMADNDATAVGAGELLVEIDYK